MPGGAQAAKLAGNSDLRVLAFHIYPNALPPMMVQVSLNLGWAILNAAGLSFIRAATVRARAVAREEYVRARAATLPALLDAARDGAELPERREDLANVPGGQLVRFAEVGHAVGRLQLGLDHGRARSGRPRYPQRAYAQGLVPRQRHFRNTKRDFIGLQRCPCRPTNPESVD